MMYWNGGTGSDSAWDGNFTNYDATYPSPAAPRRLSPTPFLGLASVRPTVTRPNQWFVDKTPVPNAQIYWECMASVIEADHLADPQRSPYWLWFRSTEPDRWKRAKIMFRGRFHQLGRSWDDAIRWCLISNARYAHDLSLEFRSTARPRTYGTYRKSNRNVVVLELRSSNRLRSYHPVKK